jgi:PAS domain S-box-containing protein
VKNKIDFDVLFNHATIGIIVTDENGLIVQGNPFLLNQFGYTAGELIGQPIELLIPGRFRGRHVQHRDNFREHPRSRPMGAGLELFALRKDGTEFPVEVSLGAYKTSEGQFMLAFISDITYRKEKEASQKKEAELRIALEKEKELNELKSRFVSMASHEFRTPLSTILSSTFLISKYEKTEEQPQREKHIQRIVSAVNMLTDILNDFLSVGKIEEGRVQVRYSTFNVEELVSNTISEMNGLQRKRQSVSYIHEGPEELHLDAALLKHIVMNLLSNAIKFSPEGATIHIFTRQDEQGFILRVKDEGIGISAEDQEHLFERFFRGTNVSNIQGTGLGLHIIGKYAELMNGEVSFQSEIGKGTEFTVTFQPYGNHLID